MHIFPNLFKKAANINSGNSVGGVGVSSNLIQILTGNTLVNNFSSVELVKLNKGWAGICNSKNATTCSSIPIKLYYKKSGDVDIYKTQYKKLNRNISQNIAKSLNIKLLRNEEIVEIEEHPFLDLMENINSTMNYTDFMILVQEYLGIMGNSYVEIIKDKEGLPVELKVLLGEYVEVFATGDKDGTITRYEYSPDSKHKVNYSSENILQFANYIPGNNLVGKGELENCINAVTRYNYYDAYESYYNANYGHPDLVVSYKNKINEKDLKELYKQWSKRFTGVQNAGKPMISSGDMEIKELNTKIRDMNFEVGRKWCVKEIAAAFGVPLAFIELDSVNYASSNSAMNYYYRNTIYPKMSCFCEKLNEKLIPMYNQENLFCWFYEAQVEDPKDKYINVSNALKDGIISREEAREALGYLDDGKSNEGGDKEDSEG